MLLASIYRGAEVVLSWLGQDEAEIILGLETLELIAAETDGQDFETDDSLGLDWMMKYPDLCVRDIEDELTVMANRSLASIFKVFDQPHRTRVWILQEMSLAKRLIFYTAGKYLEYTRLEQAWKVLRAAQRTVVSPTFRAPKAIHKDVLSTISGDFWNWSIAQRLNAGRARVRSFDEVDNGAIHKFSGYSMAFFGIHFEATDPKDHIYGLLALSEIDMVPDYNLSTPAKSVYSAYIASYLRFWAQYRAEIRLAHDYVEQHQLFFLHYCGIRLYENILGLPSWAPNFPEESRKGLAGKFVEADADANAFGHHEHMAYVSRDTLFVIGIELDRIVHVSQAPAGETWWDGSMLAYFKDFVSRNVLYRKMALEPLRVNLKILELSHGKAANDEDYLFFALRCLQFILSPEIMSTGSMNLSAIGLEESHFNDSFLKT